MPLYLFITYLALILLRFYISDSQYTNKKEEKKKGFCDVPSRKKPS